MKLKLFLAGLIFGLITTACAHAPATQIVDVPIPIHADKIVITKCPDLPIDNLTSKSTWDQRLSSWYASLTILRGCVDARDQIIEKLNN